MQQALPWIAFLLVTASALAGCHEQAPLAPGNEDDSGDGSPPNGDGGPPPDGEDGPSDPDDHTIAVGQQSGFSERVERVIRTQDEWHAFWENHTARHMPPPEPPEVDFNSSSVIAVVLGDRPDGCHHVRITKLVYSTYDGSVRVGITEYVPTEDMVCTEVITQPFHFRTLGFRPGRAEFESEIVEGEPDAT